MNNLEIQSMSQKKVTALHTLSDEVYPLLRNAELAKFMANDLLSEYFGGDEPDGSQKCGERLMCGYGRAKAQVQILMDYLHSLETSLEKLEQIASGKNIPTTAPTEDMLLGLLMDAAKTGKVNSKQLGQILQSVSSLKASAIA